MGKLNNKLLGEIKILYIQDKLSTREIAEKYEVSHPTINKFLKDNGVDLRPCGSMFIGGKSASYKRNYTKHKEKRSAYYKTWAQDNKENLNKYRAEWRDTNRESLNEYKRTYEKDKKNKEPHYKFATYTRTAIWETLKTKKGTGIFKHMSYTLDELINHVETLFTVGMSWDNYGDWHLDHKIPLVTFKFKSFEDEDFKQCWALSNLQPLWSTTREIDGVIYIGNLNKNCRY